jgi:hypothetical protein
MGDLERGRYPLTHPLSKLFGAFNATQGNLALRSNAEWLGLSGVSDGALAATGVACAVAIPVEQGDVIKTISIFVGATAEATGTHAFAALYSGDAVPVLLGQSTDNTGAGAAAASGRFGFTLASGVIIANAAGSAPNGFVYASIAFAAGTIPTAMSVATPTAVGYQLYPTAPLFLSATHGSGLTTTAPATIASPAAKAVAPIVVLS